MSRYLHIWEDEDGNNKEVILKTLFAYGMGDFASNLCWTFIGSYLSVFYTDAVGLAPAIASAIMLIAKIWDGVNDPMFGVIAERTTQRKGVLDHIFSTELHFWQYFLYWHCQANQFYE